MGGEIGLESEYGKGSRFWFRIPMKAFLGNYNEYPTLPPNTVIAVAANDDETCQRVEQVIDKIGNPGYVIKLLPAHEVTNTAADDFPARCIIADCESLSGNQIEMLASAGRTEDTFYIAYDTGRYDRNFLLESGYQQIIRSFTELENAFVFAASSLGTGSRTDTATYSLQSKDGDHVRRVLVAEDSAMNRQVFKGILGYMGLDVNFANNGIEALKRLKEEVFDLLIVDIQMPGISGFEVINRCKTLLSGKPRMPIVVVTGDVTKEVQDECNQLGVDRFLSKPVQSERLRGVVYELLTD
jgi:CheY-like chemotaxis protein